MKNWLITDTGIPLNIDFLSKIQNAAAFATPKPKSNIYFHGISGGPALSGSTIEARYNTPAIALASLKRVMKTILLMQQDVAGVNVDLTIPQTVINTPTATNLLTGVANTDSVVTINGGVFSTNNPVVNLYLTSAPYVTAIPCKVNSVISEQCAFTCNVAADTYDIIYTDDDGGSAELLGQLIIT